MYNSMRGVIMSKWLVDIQPSFKFSKDCLYVFIAFKNNNGEIHPVKPFTIEPAEVGEHEGGTTYPEPTFELPTELAQILFDHLAHHLLSVEGNTVATITRLERDVTWYKTNLERLISGLNKIGGR